MSIVGEVVGAATGGGLKWWLIASIVGLVISGGMNGCQLKKIWASEATVVSLKAQNQTLQDDKNALEHDKSMLKSAVAEQSAKVQELADESDRIKHNAEQAVFAARQANKQNVITIAQLRKYRQAAIAKPPIDQCQASCERLREYLSKRTGQKEIMP